MKRCLLKHPLLRAYCSFLRIFVLRAFPNYSATSLIYNEFNFPIYVIFDGDKGKQKNEDRNLNKKLTKLLRGVETDWPETEITGKYAIFEDNIEAEFKDALPFYERLELSARRLYGLTKNRHKEIVAKYVAESLDTTDVPDFIKYIITKIEEAWSSHYVI